MPSVQLFDKVPACESVDRFDYNKHEKNYQSANLDLLSGEGTQYPETFWVSKMKFWIINWVLVNYPRMEWLEHAREGFINGTKS